ncbi:hypothetical protein ACF0H5_019243 [Mactra antiquata]
MSDTEKMAPTASIESVTVVRAWKVIAVLTGFINLIVMVMYIGASAWVVMDGKRMGLWETCFYVSPGRVDCEPNNPPDWMYACRGLALLGLIICFISSVVTCIGINASKFRTRYRCYFVSMLLYFLALMFVTTTLIIYPLKFSEEIGERAGDFWSFGWSYGLGWGSAGLLGFSALILCIDKDADEIIFREKTAYENGIEEDEGERLTESMSDKSETETDIAYADEYFK